MDTVIVSRVNSCHRPPSQPPQKWPKTVTQLSRRQQPRMILLQELHFTQRCKQTCPPSSGSAHSGSSHNKEPGPARGTYVFVRLSVLQGHITPGAEREEHSGTIERGGEDRQDTGKEESRGMRSTRSHRHDKGCEKL